MLCFLARLGGFCRLQELRADLLFVKEASLAEQGLERGAKR